MTDERKTLISPLCREPDAVKAARTVLTGGMRKRTKCSAPCPYPLGAKQYGPLQIVSSMLLKGGLRERQALKTGSLG